MLKKMTVKEWIAVQDNPIQRDTERHAARAKHLLAPLPIHAIVYAAELPNGQLVKLDGHTRALLWKRNQVRQPPEVLVNILAVKSMDEAKDLYKTLDNKVAVETSQDIISGALHGISFVPESSLLKKGSFTTALRVSYNAVVLQKIQRQTDIYSIVKFWTPELVALDVLDMHPNDLTTGQVAAFILTYRKHNDRILPFWRAVAGDGGMKIDGKMDGVQALQEFRLSRLKKYGGSAVEDMCSRALTAAEGWLEDKTFTSHPRPTEIAYYLGINPEPKFQLITAKKA